MRRIAAEKHGSHGIRWVGDALPSLDHVHGLGLAYDLVLLSAVWQHVAPADRPRAFRKLATLMKPSGVLVMTLRHGPAPPGMQMHPTATAEIEGLARAHGLEVLRVAASSDQGGRASVTWDVMALRMPDDGTGAWEHRDRATARRDAAHLCREVRPAHPLRLRRDRSRASDRGKHAHALPGGQRRPPAPGVEGRLDAVPGIDEGGRLSIRGPNIMAGYLKADAPGQLQPPVDGWHDTGDIVAIDAAGFVTIKGRAKRFAKIGGEMVSLPAVEGYAAQLWPGSEHAVVTRPDARKGEQLALFRTHADATAAALQAWARANGVSELVIPRDIRVFDALPVLGTGKIDYVTLTNMAASAPRPNVLEAVE